MRTYTVPLIKEEQEEHETRFGALATPESFMGRKPVHIYYDEDKDEFFTSTLTPDMVAKSGTYWVEFVVTIWPRDEEHRLQRLKEVEDFWRGVETPLTAEEN